MAAVGDALASRHQRWKGKPGIVVSSLNSLVRRMSSPPGRSNNKISQPLLLSRLERELFPTGFPIPHLYGGGTRIIDQSKTGGGRATDHPHPGNIPSVDFSEVRKENIDQERGRRPRSGMRE